MGEDGIGHLHLPHLPKVHGLLEHLHARARCLLRGRKAYDLELVARLQLSLFDTTRGDRAVVLMRRILTVIEVIDGI